MITDIYFGSPVWIDNKPEFINSANKASDEYIKEARTKNKSLIKDTGDFGLVHHSRQLLGDTRFKDFMDYIGRKAWDFLDWQGFDMKDYQTMFSEMWVQEFAKKGGGYHSLHVHSNDHISGFYFLKCSSKTSFLIFNDPRPGAQMTKLRLKKPTEVTHASSMVHHYPKPGMLLFFNSYLPHEFSVDIGKKPFRFIHFNLQSVLKGMAKNV
tara:strand:+ start:150 stop:779 length:630 start_codon:yes stop_codon:yes gene_type:complete